MYRRIFKLAMATTATVRHRTEAVAGMAIALGAVSTPVHRLLH
jgi:hypothetical protein